MINVKLEYNSETEIATYTLMKDGVAYDEEFVIELQIPFALANSLSCFLDELIFLSRSNGYNNLLMELDKFVNSHY